MPATCGSTTRLRALREKREAQEAKKQVPLKMRTRKQPVRTKACAKSKANTQKAQASPKASKAVKQAPKRCGKRKSMDQAGDAKAQAVPSRGLQDATQTSTSPVAESAKDQDKASVDQKAASNHGLQGQTGAEPAVASATPSKHPKQEDGQPAVPGDEAAAACRIPQQTGAKPAAASADPSKQPKQEDEQLAARSNPQHFAAPKGNAAAANAAPSSTAAPSEAPGNPSSSAQHAAPLLAAFQFPPQQPLPLFGAGPLPEVPGKPSSSAQHAGPIPAANWLPPQLPLPQYGASPLGLQDEMRRRADRARASAWWLKEGKEKDDKEEKDRDEEEEEEEDREEDAEEVEEQDDERYRSDPYRPDRYGTEPRTIALQMMANAGIRKEDGALALAAVPENPGNTEMWAMTAIEWLTTQMELRNEISDMDRAMQVSLEEAEQQKQAQAQKRPLDMPEEELLSHFKGSVLIPKLKESACGDIILTPPLKGPIVELLELEQKACRWYSTAGTKGYFLRLGDHCKAEAALHFDDQPEGSSCKRQKVDSAADDDHSTGDNIAKGTSVFCAFLCSKAAELKDGLYQMPGTSGEVPAIFLAKDGAAEDNEVMAGEQAKEELVLDGDAIVLDP